MERYTLGVSSCLLGEKVRYNGADKRDIFISEYLSRWFQFTPLCPERDAGFPIPRDPVNQVQYGKNYKLMNIHSGDDVSLSVTKWLKGFNFNSLDGLILKSRSPSCGVLDASIYTDYTFKKEHKGAGFVTRYLIEQHPYLPLIDEKSLQHLESREKFIRSVFVLREWRSVIHQPKNIYEFHEQHRNLFLSINRFKAFQMDILLNKHIFIRRRVHYYGKLLLRLLKEQQKEFEVYSVLRSLFQKLRKDLNRENRYELLHMIDLYRQKQVPLLEPVTLINHYVKKSNMVELFDDKFLNPPYPEVNLLYHA